VVGLFDPMNIPNPGLKISVWGEVENSVDRWGCSVDVPRVPQNLRLSYYAITENAIAEGKFMQLPVFD